MGLGNPGTSVLTGSLPRDRRVRVRARHRERGGETLAAKNLEKERGPLSPLEAYRRNSSASSLDC